MRKQPSLSLAVALAAALFALPAWAGDQPQLRAAPMAIGHYGSSPFNPPEPEDTLFVVDSGGGLDTGCTFRDGSPLQIHLPIKRVVGKTNGDGTLSDPNHLILGGFISPTARLIMPVFDIDVPYELDNVSINGHYLGSLTGSNNTWKSNEFSVPIEYLKFGQPGGAPGDNIITIDIDVYNTGWCMSVDWTELKFNAVAPIFLVHGTNASSTSWDGDTSAFKDYIDAQEIPYSSDINLTPNGTIMGNASILAGRLQQLANRFGAKKCHIVAHSKGGNDVRGYLSAYYDKDQLEVLSVTTLSTPHKGTVIADITRTARQSINPFSSNADVNTVMGWDLWILQAVGATPVDPALGENTTTSMSGFNAAHPWPTFVKFFTIGANADLNGNGTIEAPAETDPLLPSVLGLMGKPATGMYRALGRVAGVTATQHIINTIDGPYIYTDVQPTALYGSFHPNDLVVTVDSARGLGGNFLGAQQANHASMKSYNTAQLFLDTIRNNFPNF